MSYYSKNPHIAIEYNYQLLNGKYVQKIAKLTSFDFENDSRGLLLMDNGDLVKVSDCIQIITKRYFGPLKQVLCQYYNGQIEEVDVVIGQLNKGIVTHLMRNSEYRWTLKIFKYIIYI